MRVILLVILAFISKCCFSQINTVTILVGKNESGITKYFDSLYSLRSNAYYKIERGATDNGDLDLVVKFSIDDESFYKCSGITATFQRVKGNEYCYSQSIYGEITYAYFYLSFIKDNFTSVSEGVWEMPNSEIKGLNTVATYKKIDTGFIIFFELQEATK